LSYHRGRVKTPDPERPSSIPVEGATVLLDQQIQYVRREIALRKVGG